MKINQIKNVEFREMFSIEKKHIRLEISRATALMSLT